MIADVKSKPLLLSSYFSDDFLYPCWFRTSDMPANSTYSVLHHKSGEFVFTFDGSLEVNVESNHLIAPMNYGVWIPPIVDHECLSRYITSSCSVHIMPDFCMGLPTIPCTLETNELSRSILKYLKSLPQTMLVSDEIQRLLAVFIDQLKQMKIHSDFLPSSNDMTLRHLLEFIEATPEDNTPIQILAQKAGITVRTLNRKSHHELGMPFTEWRRRFKIVQAMHLLDQGCKVEVVAYELGYSSASAFITMFQKITGRTPRQKL